MKVSYYPLSVSFLLVGLTLVAAEDTKPTDQVKKHLGEATIAVLQGATKVEAFRIEPEPEKLDGSLIGGYPIKATGKQQNKEFAARLTTVLLDEKTLFGRQAKCFEPGIAFRLWKDKESVEVMICFDCKNLRLDTRNADGKQVKSTTGAFGPDIQPLLKLAKEAFPDDKEIQAIKEE